MYFSLYFPFVTEKMVLSFFYIIVLSSLFILINLCFYLILFRNVSTCAISNCIGIVKQMPSELLNFVSKFFVLSSKRSIHERD